jgi:S-adenosylmethionine/arginine decarboxylase-like enzyme
MALAPLPGLTYMLDGTYPNRLAPEKLVGFLTGFPQVLGMTRISDPVVASAPHGIGGLVIIAESHVAVHQWLNGDGVWVGSVTISTCRPDRLRRDVAQQHLLEELGFSIVSAKEVKWGGE